MIKVPLNKDVGSYEAKFVGPFTLRQSLCVLAAAPVCWGIYSGLTPILGGDIAGFLVLFPAALCWLIGWYKPYGMHTEMPYLTYIKEHRRIFQATMEKASLLQMDVAYQKLNRHVLTPILNRYQVPVDVQQYVIQFYINGTMAIINEWLRNDCRDSIEHVASVIQLCINNK